MHLKKTKTAAIGVAVACGAALLIYACCLLLAKPPAEPKSESTMGSHDGTGTDISQAIDVKPYIETLVAKDSVLNYYAVDGAGTLWIWSDADRPEMFREGIQSVVSGADGLYTVFLDTAGDLYGFRADDHDNIYISFVSSRIPVLLMSDVVSVAGGTNHILALKADGSVWAIGENENGQIGNGSPSDGVRGKQTFPQTALSVLSEPVMVLDDAAFIAAGHYSSAAIKKDGTLWLWGDNACGQVGNGQRGNGYPTISDRVVPVPTQVLDDTAWVSFNGVSSYAVLSDGSVWAWGQDYDLKPGEIGQGAAQVKAFDRDTVFILDRQGNLYHADDMNTPLLSGVEDFSIIDSDKLFVRTENGAISQYELLFHWETQGDTSTRRGFKELSDVRLVIGGTDRPADSAAQEKYGRLLTFAQSTREERYELREKEGKIYLQHDEEQVEVTLPKGERYWQDKVVLSVCEEWVQGENVPQFVEILAGGDLISGGFTDVAVVELRYGAALDTGGVKYFNIDDGQASDFLLSHITVSEAEATVTYSMLKTVTVSGGEEESVTLELSSDWAPYYLYDRFTDREVAITGPNLGEGWAVLSILCFSAEQIGTPSDVVVQARLYYKSGEFFLGRPEGGAYVTLSVLEP